LSGVLIAVVYLQHGFTLNRQDMKQETISLIEGKATQMGINPALVKKELGVFLSRVDADDTLSSATVGSKAAEFIKMLAYGLTFNAAANQVYIQTRSVKNGKDANGRDVWGKALECSPTAFGEAYILQKTGAIAGYELPVLVYDCELPSLQINRGNVTAHNTTPVKPAGSKIVGGYVVIYLPNGREIAPFFGLDSIEQWKGAAISGKSSAKYSNETETAYAERKGKAEAKIQEMYSSIGFLQTKILKHAIKRIAQGAGVPVSAYEPTEDFDADTGEVFVETTPAAETPQYVADTTNPEAPF
jgi:hypothetical protein